MMQDTLLIELLTEELPPKALKLLGHTFARGIFDELSKLGFVAAGSTYQEFATPRRLAITIEKVLATQPEQQVERKGPAIASAFNAEGKPTPALQGFAKSCGIEPDALEKASDGKIEYFVFRSTKSGESLEKHLASVVTTVLKKLPAPKMMRWGNSEVQFIRPVHGLIMMLGENIIPGNVLGLFSGNQTLGHRFMSSGAIIMPHAARYEEVLENTGKVIPSFSKRRQLINAAIAKKSTGMQVLLDDEALFDEVTALVEFPVVYAGNFNKEFLSVPQECLVLSMKQHQKHFPLADANKKLLPQFLVVSNLETSNPDSIIHGNERVLRARLSDAKFFFEQDQKIRLEERTPKLANVVYHNKLGSQLQRVERIQKLAGEIAQKLKADVALAERAAYLCKADLLTDMVSEFPELQGTMGMYYARQDGENNDVALAIEGHYHPRFAGDALPVNVVGACVALADKLDTVVGIYGIGMIPTGDKDPFALRRHALGVLRILMETPLPLDLFDLIDLAQAQFPADSIEIDRLALRDFFGDRLKNYLREQGNDPLHIEAVIAQLGGAIHEAPKRLAAVQQFAQLPEAKDLAAANKRVLNIIRKNEEIGTKLIDPDRKLMTEAAEIKLFDSLEKIGPVADKHFKAGDYESTLRLLAGIKPDVDSFFDNVMVMVDDVAIRNNRAALLQRLGTLMNRVADISKLAG